MSARSGLVLLLLLASCNGDGAPPIAGPRDDRPVGGPCEYLTIPGTCEVTSVAAAPSNPTTDCTAPTAARYRFTATDGAAASRANALESREGVLYLDGQMPPAACLARRGVQVGLRFACERQLISRGTCTPSIDRAPELDLASCRCRE